MVRLFVSAGKGNEKEADTAKLLTSATAGKTISFSYLKEIAPSWTFAVEWFSQ
jgi:hypothetical protein